ncbi:MAG TPA: type II toxin-antitoxin system HicA family toxin [Candidatus Tripitaka californicus]|uniref:type II toxin-antitoxin system HicA family toxin n=1 Tax=Candidatus Tripitaka californicus TaxID=3367616 RepID=UPI002BC92813|nr:type II toxin-antitoxin system HicA family toxin [Planctomycetota bacterium]HLA38196.1 type II toxin-antitoxin system HicA family toxin [Candidatus Brocadiales bacterium]
MTEKLPRITAAEAIRALERGGFFLVRQSGSHKIYKNKEGKRVTIPYHAGKILHPKVLKSILKDADLTIEGFKKLMR